VPGTRHYCTLFDTRYLARAVTLYRSLERHEPDFVLHAACMDDASHELLEQLALPHLKTLPIAEVEAADRDLEAARSSRSSYEYCWTCSPAVCRHVLAREPGLEMLTYLDADLHLSSTPDPLFAELGDGSILLVRHRISPELERSVGIYNVGWLTFRNDADGIAALDWWRERCIEWCYERVEPGRFADQKYLDQVPLRFAGVRISSLGAAGLAPWNQRRHEVVVTDSGAPPLVDGDPLIYFHHAGLRLHAATPLLRALARRSSVFRLVSGPVDVVFALATESSSPAVESIWRGYVCELTRSLGELAPLARPALSFDRPNPRLAARSMLVRRMPPAVEDAYHRLPRTVRHRIWRWFASA
jgi:hypothetical protein